MSDVGTLNGLFKEAYAEKPEELVPVFGKLAKLIKFVAAKRMNGKYYNAPVVLSNESGFTYAGVTEAAYDLNAAIGMTEIQAQVPGLDQVLSSVVSFQTVARAKSVNSFMGALRAKFQNMLAAATKRLESTMIHGQTSIGVAALQAVATTDPLVIVIDAESFAAGLWAGSENSQVSFSRVIGGVPVDAGRSFTVKKVDIDAHSISFAAGTSGTPGSLVTLEAAIEAYALNIHWYGSVTTASPVGYNEAAGLKKIISNDGTLFGISAADYDLWRGNVIAESGSLTMQKLLSAVAVATAKGLDGDVTVLVPPRSWADLSSELAAQRMFDGSYNRTKAENGTENIEYYYMGGSMTIISHPMMFDGDVIVFPTEKVIRIGARELGLGGPDGAEEIFFTLPTAAGYGLRAYCNEGLYCETPGQTVLIQGITPSSV